VTIVPLRFREAAAFVRTHHRHHGPSKGQVFSLGLADDAGRIVGCAVVGRPVARFLDDGWTLEVTRLCTDGEPNACSALYRAAWRAAQALGYRRLVTYTLPSEPGASLRGAGLRCLGKAGGGTWNRRDRPRVDVNPNQRKIRWEITAE